MQSAHIAAQVIRRSLRCVDAAPTAHCRRQRCIAGLPRQHPHPLGVRRGDHPSLCSHIERSLPESRQQHAFRRLRMVTLDFILSLLYQNTPKITTFLSNTEKTGVSLRNTCFITHFDFIYRVFRRFCGRGSVRDTVRYTNPCTVQPPPACRKRPVGRRCHRRPRTEVEDIVRRFDHVQIMLDDNDRVACVHQLLQNIHKPVDICDMQTGGRLIEDIDGLAGRAFDSSVASLARCASPPDSVVED